MKICPVGAELFHVNRQTDRHDETSSRFSQLCEPANNEHSFYISLHDFSSLESLFLLVLKNFLCRKHSIVRYNSSLC